MIKIRQSALNAYETCPRLCKEVWGSYGTPDRADDDDSSNKYALTGIALHKTMEWLGRHMMDGMRVPLLDLHDRLDENFNEIPHVMFDGMEDRTNYYNSLHEQLTWVYEQVGDITPIDVERVFDDMFLFPNMPECTGTIDRIQGNMRTKDVDILDYKSGKQATKADLNSSIQATMYSLAFKQMYGFYPRRFIFVYTKLKKTRDIIITPDFIERGTSRIIDIWGHMARGEFDPPEKPNKYFCQHFCEKTVGCPRMKRPKGWEQV